MSNFVSLHNHSHFSILQALPSPKELFSRAKELGMPALALTDTGTFAGTWDAFKASKETGVKLIIGAEFYFLSDISRRDEKTRRVILLAKNAEGYRNLLTMNRKAFDNPLAYGKKILPVIDWKMLEEYSKGVICLTSGGNGIIARHINEKNFEAAENDAKRLLNLFGRDDFALEVQPNAMTRQANNMFSGINQVFTNYQLIKLAKKLNIRVVPTCSTFYLKKEDAKTHDVLLAVGAMQPVYSNARLKYNVPDFYLKSGNEVKAFFARNFGEEYAEEMLANTSFLADRCEISEWIDPKFSNAGGKELPEFPVKDVEDYKEFKEWLENQSEKIKLLKEDSAYLRFKAFTNFEKRVLPKISNAEKQNYIDRIEEELRVLNHQGFSSYMLIVWDYLDWSRKNSILINFGRGSCGGSYLCYLLDIHRADPFKYGLIFERFHNIQKTQFPDIDIDVAAKDRDKLINYINTKYGNDKVAFISNFAKITPKVYSRDISRSLEFGGSRAEAVRIGNFIADAISKEYKDTVDFNKLMTSPLFMECVKHYPGLSKNSVILGKIRNTSLHAGAQVLSRRPLTGLVPLRLDKDGLQSIEYEKNNTEDNGLLKVDVLGLSTLDLIDDVLKLIKKYKNIDIKIDDIKFEEYDKKTYDLISAGDNFGVFQLGTSGGTIDLCKKIKPKSIDDLAIITTLARPAAKDIREDFIATRDGKKKFQLMHQSLKGAFEGTYGFGLYDESILRLGQDVAGWNMNEADRIRKMIKDKGKNPEKDQKLRDEFIKSAAAKQNISIDFATELWNAQLNSFKNYTFNRSHAVMYSFTSFITAYLKAHYPIEFLLATLMAEVKSNAPNAEENIDKAKQELRARGVKILPPDINKSQIGYELLDDKTLLTGLDALLFLGDAAIEDIIEKRPFKDFNDFMIRCDIKKVKAPAIHALAASGCLDSFNLSRRSMYLYCQDYRKKLQVWLKKHDPNIDQFVFPWEETHEWTKPELFALEKHYLGESFATTKLEAFGKFFLDKHSADLEDVKSSSNKTYFNSIKAEIKSVFELRVKKETSKFRGQEMAKVTLEDAAGTQCSLTIFPERWAEIKTKLQKTKYKFEPGNAIKFAGTSNLYENEMGIIFEQFLDMVPPPALPKDLKAKKVAIKDGEKVEGSSLVEQLEDELFSEGLIDLQELFTTDF